MSTPAFDRSDDVAAEYAEAALQALHVKDLLEHIPVFKSTLAAAKVIGSVRDHLLLRKIGIFLRAISVIPAVDRRALAERLHADPLFNESLGEYLIELLDRIDGQRKPAMVGAVFAAFAFESVDTKTLLRLNAAILAIPTMEISEVRVLDTFNRSPDVLAETSPMPPDRLSLQAIANAGFAAPEVVASGVWFKLNEIGARFLELDLDSIDPVVRR